MKSTIKVFPPNTKDTLKKDYFYICQTQTQCDKEADTQSIVHIDTFRWHKGRHNGRSHTPATTQATLGYLGKCVRCAPRLYRLLCYFSPFFVWMKFKRMWMRLDARYCSVKMETFKYTRCDNRLHEEEWRKCWNLASCILLFTRTKFACKCGDCKTLCIQCRRKRAITYWRYERGLGWCVVAIVDHMNKLEQMFSAKSAIGQFKSVIMCRSMCSLEEFLFSFQTLPETHERRVFSVLTHTHAKYH